jgi:hypothetical protein
LHSNNQKHTIMNLEMKRRNEHYFKITLNLMNEGGVYIWPDTGHVFTKKEGKFVGNKQACRSVREIITRDFFENFFSQL